MSYIVVYQRADGSSGLEECATLDLAVVAAERLRNVDSVENPRIFKTEEVSFDFRPYYRVEVSEDFATPEPTATPEPAAAVVPEPSAPRATATEAEPTLTPETAIDPWASADASTIDYSKPAASAAAPTPDPVVASATEPAEFSSGEAIQTAADATPEGVDEAAADTASESDDASEDEDSAWPSRGLFSSPNVPEPPKDLPSAAALAEDVSDAVPPRRGLFGR